MTAKTFNYLYAVKQVFITQKQNGGNQQTYVKVVDPGFAMASARSVHLNRAGVWVQSLQWGSTGADEDQGA